MGLIDVYRINPADAFSVYSPTLKKTQEITYYTLLAKIRGDLNITAVDSNIDNWNEAYDEVVVSGAVTGYETKTITLTRRDGSTISFDFQDLNPQSVDTLDMVTTRGNVTLNTIDVGGVLTPWVDLDITYSNGNVIGRVSWDQDNATMDVGLNANTILKVGQDDMWYVKNQTGSTINKGVAVMAVGTLGASGRILVSPMVANGSVSPRYLLGITAESIPNGSDGYVLAKGKLRQINTSAFTDGQVLWCSPTTPGALTATEPTAPNLKLAIAFVVRAANNGTLAIRTNPGETLSDNHQVQFGTLANNDVLTYVSANSRWQNVPISSIAASLAFSTIAVTGSSTIVADSTSDTLTVTAGTGITLAGNATTDTLTITNDDRGSSQNIFKNIAVAGQTTVVADSNNDTLTLIAGTNVTLTTDATNDTITINSTGGGGGASGTVTYIDVVGGTGISTTGGPVTTTGTITVTNTDKGSDQFIWKNIAVPGATTIVVDNNDDTLTIAPGTGISIATNNTTDTLTITNSSPDQTVVLTEGANIDITGTYPNFTISSTDQFVGTVTSVDLTPGTGISVLGGPITSSGSITVTNTDRGSSQNIFKTIDVAGQTPVVATTNTSILELQAGTGMTITTSAPGSWVRFNNSDTGSAQNIFKNVAVAGQSTIVADSNDDTLTAAAGTGITLTTNATTDTLTITNSAPDQVVTLSSGTGISVTGAYPSFTVTNTDRGSSQNIFKNVAVAGQNTIVADSNNDTLTMSSGTGITITTNDTTDTLTVTNSAPDQVVSITGAGTSVVTGPYPNFTVTSADQFVGTVTSVGLTPGTGISIAGSTITSSGTFTVTNSDRGSSQNIFKNIAVPTQTTITASSNNDTFTIKPGSGISATTTGNDITLSNTDPGSAQNIFKNVAVAGQSTVVADTNNDTLTLVAGSNIVLTTNATTDSITIDASIPVIATPGDAVYERDYVTPFVVPAAWAMVNLNTTDIRVSVNKDLSADNRGYFFVTFEVESTQVGPQFRMFKYKLYNANTTTDVVDSESYWVGYMYGTSEVPYTTFSFHIPSADAGVDNGDVIELHVQELSSGTAPDITYAALSYIDAVG